jgi:hypothetical protein
MKKETWLNCNIMKLSMIRKGHRHIASHLTVSGIPLYQHIDYNVDICSGCLKVDVCDKNKGQKEAW